MGLHEHGDQLIVMPFRPSTTLNNLLELGCAVVNYTDDVRYFSACLTDQREDWPMNLAKQVKGRYLAEILAHDELRLEHVEDDPLRPKLFCDIVHSETHRPFKGFNRAQSAVIEAAILTSRLGRLPLDKIQTELAYLSIGYEKTAGQREKIAWNMLMATIQQYKINHPDEVKTDD